jgi:uncharacterized integral membrane protein
MNDLHDIGPLAADLGVLLLVALLTGITMALLLVSTEVMETRKQVLR